MRHHCVTKEGAAAWDQGPGVLIAFEEGEAAVWGAKPKSRWTKKGVRAKRKKVWHSISAALRQEESKPPPPCPRYLKLSVHFEPIESHFGHSKVTKCLENGLFCDQKWVKNGPKMWFSKNDPRPFVVFKQVK